MASKSMSPQGALLRASRMFAMPPPLPKSQGELSSTVVRGSESSTQIHPLYQTVTTTPSSLARGDWGFKRPLPLRSTTKTSTPLLRVEAVDTFEHITQYASAADHTLTLQKWQELGMPVSTPSGRERTVTGTTYKSKGKSVFEDNVDVISSEYTGIGKDGHRWKFKGPWLAGQTEGEFNQYLAKQVRRQKPQFYAFLREQLAQRIYSEASRAAIENGDAETIVAVKAEDISEDQFRVYLRELRHDQTELFQHIRTFFDLAPSPSAAAEHLGEAFLQSLLDSGKPDDIPTIDATKYQDPKSDSPYAANGPPKTHPSAGLSYLRSSSYLTNHPIHGPQAKKPPVEARLVQPRRSGIGNFAPKIGVAGFIAAMPNSIYSFNASNLFKNRKSTDPLPPPESLDPDSPGGSKLYVHAVTANVNPDGRLVIETEHAGEEAIAVHKGTTGQISASARRPTIPPRPFARVRNSNGDYGLGLE